MDNKDEDGDFSVANHKKLKRDERQVTIVSDRPSLSAPRTGRKC